MKRIAVINDISGLGRCSLAAALPIISACGIDCCPLPIASFTKQTAFENFNFKSLSDQMPKFISGWKNEKFQGIYTGFFIDKIQMEYAAEFINSHSEAKTVLIDPVLGDDGLPYPVCGNELQEGMKILIKSATVITPNLTEFAILANAEYEDLQKASLDKIYNVAKTLLGEKLKTVIVTGIHSKNDVVNLIATNKGYKSVASHRFHGSFSGTGDIFASVVVSMLTKGKSTEYAVKKAVRLISKSAKDTIKSATDPRYGIEFQKHLDILN